MLARRPLLLVLLLTIFATIVFIRGYGDSDGLKKVGDSSWDHIHDKIKVKPPTRPKGKSCKQNLIWLEPYKLSTNISYVSRDIITKPGAKERPLVTILDQSLFADFEIVTTDPTKLAKTSLQECLPPLSLEVSNGIPGIPDASNMIFALQTTIGRLRNSVKPLNRWLPHTGARLFCIVKENPDKLAKNEDMQALEKEFHDLGMNVTIIHPVNEKDSFEQRYFSLVSVMYAARNEKTQWMITIDDDTFFPSLKQLQKELLYHDYRKEQYISALSENWWAVDHYGLMGFGGASIILSVPLVKIMDEHKHECSDHPSTISGDVTVMDCIYRFSTTKMTNIPELYQLDVKMDLSGFYESGRPVLSLHHWKEGPEKFDLERTHLVADICDDCFLQRWQFDDSLILSNGFSIHTYPLGHLTGSKGGVLGTGLGNDAIEKINLVSMEETWDENFNVKHSLGPLRPALPKEAKVQYKMIDSMFVDIWGKPGLRQLYVKRGEEGANDEVMVLNWIPGDEDYKRKMEGMKVKQAL